MDASKVNGADRGEKSREGRREKTGGGDIRFSAGDEPGEIKGE